MVEEEVVDDLSDDDDEEGASSKNRATKEVTELYYFILSLAYNNVATKCEGLKKEEQEAKMIEYSNEWVDLVRSDFGNVSRKFMGKNGVSEDQLKAQITKDTGRKMLTKAKLVVSVVNNHLSSHWKEPENSASGKGREGEN
jgi:hypothetical protein